MALVDATLDARWFPEHERGLIESVHRDPPARPGFYDGSYGIAYVLDEAGDFERRCNLAMVELEPISDEDEALEHTEHQGGDLEGHGRVDIDHDMTRYDAQRLRTLIEKHMHYTDSARAHAILENWSEYLPKFVKVMPMDYRRALEEMKAAQLTEQPPVAAQGGRKHG